MLTHRERMLAVLRGEKPDRIPWAPRLEMWYRARQKAGTLPAKYRGWDIRSIYRDQNLEWPAKGGSAFSISVQGVETITRKKGEETYEETITPVGTVSTLRRHSPELRAQGIGSLEVEHMIKGRDDYQVVEWIYQHSKIVPSHEAYQAFDMACGDDGVPQQNTPWTPAGQVLNRLIGWNQCYYHLQDYPQEAERLMRVITDFCWDMHRVCAESPALIISHGSHYHSEMTPPPIFKEYFLPYLKEVSAYYHQHSKLLQFHGDADVSGLEEYLIEAGYDIAEVLVTSPMVPLTLERARQVWGDRMIIWGGIPSIILCEPFTDAEFEAHMRDLFRVIAPGDAFILGVADMVVPATKWERFERVAPMVEKYGQYPIDPAKA